MNRILKTILIISITVFGIGILLVPTTLAQNDNLVVQFEQTPLFDEANFLPGESITRWAKVTNKSGNSQRIATEAINYPEFPVPANVPTNDLSRALLIVIREKGGSDLYGGSMGEKTLFNFYQDGETYLSDVDTGASKEYEYEVIFPAEMGNYWQGKTTNFDILVGFQGVEGGVPPGGGTNLPPGLTIAYEKPFYIGTDTTKITWFTSYKATSRVIYDTQAGKFNLNAPLNYGYTYSTIEKDTPASTNGLINHEVWLIGLSSNTTYYYRTVSHGSFAISQEHSFTTLASVPTSGSEETVSISEEPASNSTSASVSSSSTSTSTLTPTSGSISTPTPTPTNQESGQVAGEKKEAGEEIPVFSPSQENSVGQERGILETPEQIESEESANSIFWLLLLILGMSLGLFVLLLLAIAKFRKKIS